MEFNLENMFDVALIQRKTTMERGQFAVLHRVYDNFTQGKMQFGT